MNIHSSEFESSGYDSDVDIEEIGCYKTCNCPHAPTHSRSHIHNPCNVGAVSPSSKGDDNMEHISINC